MLDLALQTLDRLLERLVPLQLLSPVDQLGPADLLDFDGKLEGAVQEVGDRLDVRASNSPRMNAARVCKIPDS